MSKFYTFAIFAILIINLSKVEGDWLKVSNPTVNWGNFSSDINFWIVWIIGLFFCIALSISSAVLTYESKQPLDGLLRKNNFLNEFFRGILEEPNDSNFLKLFKEFIIWILIIFVAVLGLVWGGQPNSSESSLPRVYTFLGIENAENIPLIPSILEKKKINLDSVLVEESDDLPRILTEEKYNDKEYQDVRDNLKKDLVFYKNTLTENNIEELLDEDYIKSLKQEKLQELKNKLSEYKVKPLTEADIDADTAGIDQLLSNQDFLDEFKRNLQIIKEKLTQDNIEQLFNKQYIKDSLEQEELQELKEEFLEYKDKRLTDNKITELLSKYKQK